MNLTKNHLLTKEIAEKIPMLYSTQHIECDERTIHVKFFNPAGNWTWYAAEACAYMNDGKDLTLKDAWDKQDQISEVYFFGCVDGFVKEWGEFTLSELLSVPLPLGLHIERDYYFSPKQFKLIE